LWTGGISFGGVVAFIFADLLILPILNIYRRYYGIRMAILLAATFYLTAAVAGYAVELIFGGIGWIPDRVGAHLPTEGISWNYTTWLNIAFLTLAAVLVARFLCTGGGPMLAMMGGDPEHPQPGHAGHAAGH
ncbi:MAG: permease, partial [Pseudonocardiaceae bacterium]